MNYRDTDNDSAFWGTNAAWELELCPGLTGDSDCRICGAAFHMSFPAHSLWKVTAVALPQISFLFSGVVGLGKKEKVHILNIHCLKIYMDADKLSEVLSALQSECQMYSQLVERPQRLCLYRSENSWTVSWVKGCSSAPAWISLNQFLQQFSQLVCKVIFCLRYFCRKSDWREEQGKQIPKNNAVWFLSVSYLKDLKQLSQGE